MIPRSHTWNIISPWEPFLRPMSTQVQTIPTSLSKLGFSKGAVQKRMHGNVDLTQRNFQKTDRRVGSGNKEITQVCSTKQNPREGNVGSVPQVDSRDSMDYTSVHVNCLPGKIGITPNRWEDNWLYSSFIGWRLPQALQVVPVLRQDDYWQPERKLPTLPRSRNVSCFGESALRIDIQK